LKRQLDQTDRAILKILRADATTSKAEIGRRVKLAASAVFERIKRLEETGVIRGYGVRVDSEAIGLPVLAFVHVSESKPVKGKPTGPQLAALPGVEEVHKVAGDDCYLVKVRLPGTRDLAVFLDQHVARIRSVSGIRTTIVLQTIRD
jgi:Lrp/AsnC family leucine-responsive transcriptional regulator